MEDYKLFHRLSEGPLGPTLLVEDRASGDKCVVKQVECRDYTQALLAYNQALQLLQRLDGGGSVCRLRQLFVHWDREAHAVYLCTVSPYQELGSLGRFIERQRENKESLDEELLKSWAGQLAEGISHAHQQDLLHRNIKPSNILLSSPSSLLLGDFTVPVVMENLREVVLKRGGSLLWLAPEEMLKKGEGGGGSEKADVWSLGCVLLQLATCAVMDASDCSVLLQRLHRDPSVLEEALEEMGKVYSGEVCQMVESCLRRSVEQRPSISELMRCPALQQTPNEPTSDSETESSDKHITSGSDTSSDDPKEESCGEQD